jgi:hypothetical protein
MTHPVRCTISGSRRAKPWLQVALQFQVRFCYAVRAAPNMNGPPTPDTQPPDLLAP